MMSLAHVHVWLHAYADWERELAAESALARLAAKDQVTPKRAGFFTRTRREAGDALIRLGERLAGVSIPAAAAKLATPEDGGQHAG